MKTLIATCLLALSTASFATVSCETEASRIADAAIDLFDIGAENEIHCMAMGQRISLESLPVIQVMPPRHAFEAKYRFPCGPAPRSPKVTMMLNQDCKIVQLEVDGFSLR